MDLSKSARAEGARVYQKERAVFLDQITGSNSSGAQKICRGEVGVYVDLIPADAPQDWVMGPKMVPGEYGIFIEHLFYTCGHGQYAIATGKTPDDAIGKAGGFFRRKVSDWEPCYVEPERVAA